MQFDPIQFRPHYSQKLQELADKAKLRRARKKQIPEDELEPYSKQIQAMMQAPMIAPGNAAWNIQNQPLNSFLDDADKDGWFTGGGYHYNDQGEKVGLFSNKGGVQTDWSAGTSPAMLQSYAISQGINPSNESAIRSSFNQEIENLSSAADKPTRLMDILTLGRASDRYENDRRDYLAQMNEDYQQLSGIENLKTEQGRLDAEQAAAQRKVQLDAVNEANAAILQGDASTARGLLSPYMTPEQINAHTKEVLDNATLGDELATSRSNAAFTKALTTGDGGALMGALVGSSSENFADNLNHMNAWAQTNNVPLEAVQGEFYRQVGQSIYAANQDVEKDRALGKYRDYVAALEATENTRDWEAMQGKADLFAAELRLTQKERDSIFTESVRDALYDPEFRPDGSQVLEFLGADGKSIDQVLFQKGINRQGTPVVRYYRMVDGKPTEEMTPAEFAALSARPVTAGSATSASSNSIPNPGAQNTNPDPAATELPFEPGTPIIGPKRPAPQSQSGTSHSVAGLRLAQEQAQKQAHLTQLRAAKAEIEALPDQDFWDRGLKAIFDATRWVPFIGSGAEFEGDAADFLKARGMLNAIDGAEQVFARIIHELYGGALTANETKRMDTYMPKSTNSRDEALRKIDNLIDYFEAREEAMQNILRDSPDLGYTEIYGTPGQYNDSKEIPAYLALMRDRVADEIDRVMQEKRSNKGRNNSAGGNAANAIGSTQQPMTMLPSAGSPGNVSTDWTGQNSTTIFGGDQSNYVTDANASTVLPIGADYADDF